MSEIQFPNWINKSDGASQSPEEMNKLVNVIQNHAENLNNQKKIIENIGDGVSPTIITPTTPASELTTLPNAVYRIQGKGTYNLLVSEAVEGVTIESGKTVVTEGYDVKFVKSDSGWKVASSVKIPMQDLTEIYNKINSIIEEDVQLLELEQGLIASSTGQNQPTNHESHNYRLRTNVNKKIKVEHNEIKIVRVPTEFRVIAYKYSLDGSTYISPGGDYVTNEITLDQGYSYRLVVKAADNIAINTSMVNNNWYLTASIKIEKYEIVNDILGKTIKIKELFEQGSMNTANGGNNTTSETNFYKRLRTNVNRSIKVKSDMYIKITYPEGFLIDTRQFNYNEENDTIGSYVKAYGGFTSNELVLPSGYAYRLSIRNIDNTNITTSDLTDEFIKYEVLSRFSEKNSNEDVELFALNSAKRFDFKYVENVVGHRGFAKWHPKIPENSIDVLKVVAKLGFKAVEFDVQTTLDGQFVILHDDTIDRTMRLKSDYDTPITSRINISTLTLENVRNNYVLISTIPRFRKPIPTLDEFLRECKLLGLIPRIEIKNIPESQDEAFINTVTKYFKFDELNVVTSFDVPTLTRLNKKYKLPVVYNISAIDSVKDLTSIKNGYDVNVINLNYWGGTATQANVNAIRKLGLGVSCTTTLNSPNDKKMQQMLNDLQDLGINGMVSDYIAPSTLTGVEVVNYDSGLTFEDLTINGEVINGEVILEENEYLRTPRFNMNTPSGVIGSVYIQGNFSLDIYDHNNGRSIDNLTITDNRNKTYSIRRMFDFNSNYSINITALAGGCKISNLSYKFVKVDI